MLFNGMHHLPPIVFCIHQTEPADYHHFIVRIYAWKERGACRRIPFRLLTDVFWGNTLGFYTLLFSVIGYLNGSFRRLFYDDDIKLPIALIAVSELIYGLVTYFCMYLLRGDFAFEAYLRQIIMPELVYTILVTLILYQIILHINKKLEAEEQRSASKFV